MFPTMGGPEMILVLVVAVLVFGKKLPEVGRSLGKGIVEFKKGIRGVADDADDYSRPATTSSRANPSPAREDEFAAAVPKFEPPAPRD